MSGEGLIFLCGLHSLAFIVFHVLFWKIFHWKKNLEKVGISTRAIIQILNLQLIWIFLGMTVLCFWYTEALLNTSLGHAILICMSGFWVVRTINQIVFLRYNKWYIHLLTVSFLLGAVLFLLPLV